MRKLLTFAAALFFCAAATASVNTGTAPPLSGDCEAGDDQDAAYIQRTNPPKLWLCTPTGWISTVIDDASSAAIGIACSGTDKLRAFNAATGAFTCAADETGAGGNPCSAWPVGSVFISISATNPGTSLGCGTWTAFGAGRVLVGFDAGQTEFDTVEETGGEKTHTLTLAEMPAHSHGVTDPGHAHVTQRYPTATGGSSGFTADTSMSGTLADNTLSTKSATTGVTVNSAGGDGAHNNLQPYITTYFWKRTN